METLNFESYLNKYVGQVATIVGKGPTEFDYAKLSERPGPVFFINDAVNLEKHLRSDQESFLFFLDDHHAEHWLSTPVKHSVLVAQDAHKRFIKNEVPNKVLWYQVMMHTAPLLTRVELAKQPMLAVKFGTATPIIHFLWFCGVRRVDFIGCDGINDKDYVRQLTGGKDYDPRIEIHQPGKAGWNNTNIRACQDMMIELFGFEARYIGTPQLWLPEPVKYVSCGAFDHQEVMWRLKDGATALKLDLYTELMPDADSWAKNTAKPAFLQRMQQVFPEQRIVWVNANAVFRQEPVEFGKMAPEIDIAYTKEGNEILSWTVYLGTTQGAKEILVRWCMRLQQHPEEVDGVALAVVLNSFPCKQYVLPPLKYAMLSYEQQKNVLLPPCLPLSYLVRSEFRAKKLNGMESSSKSAYFHRLFDLCWTLRNADTVALLSNDEQAVLEEFNRVFESLPWRVIEAHPPNPPISELPNDDLSPLVPVGERLLRMLYKRIGGVVMRGQGEG